MKFPPGSEPISLRLHVLDRVFRQMPQIVLSAASLEEGE
jgi:hypothetical protein